MFVCLLFDLFVGEGVDDGRERSHAHDVSIYLKISKKKYSRRASKASQIALEEELKKEKKRVEVESQTTHARSEHQRGKNKKVWGKTTK